VKLPNSKSAWAALFVGLLLLTAGALVSNKNFTAALVADQAHSLEWGPTLFRALLVFHGLVIVAAVLWFRAKGSIPIAVPRSTTSQVTWLLLMLLSVAAIILRLWRLNTDLWFDELLSLLNFVRQPVGEILTRLPDQNNHILFSLLSHESVRLFGESPWAVRLPSVVFGGLSIWALFLLGRRLLGEREALLASALTTFSYHHIWFSQNARGYMALLFFALLAMWLWFEALERNSWKWWLAYSLAVTGGMLSHMTMAFVVAAQFVVYAFTVSRTLRTANWSKTLLPLMGFLLSVTLTLQFYALALPEFLHSGLHEVSLESEWTNPWWVIAETIRGLKFGFSGIAILAGGGLMLGAGWISMMRRHWQSAVLMVLPAFLAGGSMILLGHNLWPRFFFFCMGYMLLVAIQGAMTLPQLVLGQLKLERLGVPAGVALALLMVLVSAATVPRNYSHPKQDYSGARDFVESQRGPNDSVVAVGLAGVAYPRYYAPGWSSAQTAEELEQVRQSTGQTWLVYTLPVEVKAYRPAVWERIQTDFEVVKVFPGTLGGGEVVVCKQRPATSVGVLSVPAGQGL
jgi:mannosyltransferase